MKTPQEWNDAFDTMYNSVTSNKLPGLDAYEKSMFLTQAQEEIILGYFNPRKNKVQEGYDGSIQRQADFSNLTVVKSYPDIKPGSSDEQRKLPGAIFDTRPNNKSVILSDDILLIINESALVNRYNTLPKNGSYSDDSEFTKVRLTVLPVDYDEYSRLMSKPHKRPLQYQAWRLLNTDSSGQNRCDIIVGPSDDIQSYTVRYIKRPHPIIVAPLEDTQINGYSEPIGSEVDEVLHMPIIKRASELAKAVYSGDLQSTIAVGNTSSTELGVIPQSK